MIFYKILWWCPEVYNEFKKYEEKSNFKIFKFMKSTSKTKFTLLLLSITFNDKFWRSQLNILCLFNLHNNKGHHEKESI